MGDSTVRRVRSRDSMVGGDAMFCCSGVSRCRSSERRECFVGCV